PEYKKSLVPEILDYGASYAQLLQIHVPELHRLGYTGKGIRIGMLDTGYFLHHRAFQYLLDSNRIVATRDFINGGIYVEDPAGQQTIHGTYTLSALAGYVPDTLIGPAYNSEFVLAKTEIVNQEIQIEEDHWVAGIEWEESLGVDIVSSSLGYNRFDDSTGYTWADLDGHTAVVTIAAEMAVSKGVIVVNAAGNERNTPWHYIIAPADGDSVIAVGAVDLNGNIASFSSAGFPWDFQKGKIKPDVCACGVGTYCADAGGGYAYVNGTSLSTPLVAGTCALVLQTDTTLKPMQLRDRLWRTAYGVSSPDTLYGYGIVDAVRAAGFNYALAQTEKKIFAFPNPFEDDLTILVKASQTSQVQFSIFNAAGEKVLKSNPSLYDAENYVFFWNGKNERDEEIASGVYLVKVDIDGNSEIIKVFKNR
ncbi:MAG: S8 family peptidase, partial [candidate division Zixibacteria bacterium]|nr:S8 family peptidase [candidate division Zixibacteria bacterium]